MTKPQAFLLLLTDPSSDCIPENSSEYSDQIKESESAVRIMTTDTRAYFQCCPLLLLLTFRSVRNGFHRRESFMTAAS
ncbi:uncharacterized protein METZ01_LOCUS382655, partial [marine metagenome]